MKPIVCATCEDNIGNPSVKQSLGRGHNAINSTCVSRPTMRSRPLSRSTVGIKFFHKYSEGDVLTFMIMSLWYFGRRSIKNNGSQCGGLNCKTDHDMP